MAENMPLGTKGQAERYRAHADEALRVASGTVDRGARAQFLLIAERPTQPRRYCGKVVGRAKPELITNYQ
jgi:hypothetical protein